MRADGFSRTSFPQRNGLPQDIRNHLTPNSDDSKTFKGLLTATFCAPGAVRNSPGLRGIEAVQHNTSFLAVVLYRAIVLLFCRSYR